MSALVAAPDRLAAAYAHCERLAREHYENFPVASRLLPASMRPHIAAIYAFARRADDFADEPGPQDDERVELLDAWQGRLHAGVPAGSSPDDLIFVALQETIAAKKLPVSLFEDLLSAFRQDVWKHRYDSWAELMDYCRRSANPVGRLVLRVADYHDDRLDAASDAVCTALQLANFWQDFGRDWANGRLYLPLEQLERHGADTSALAGSSLPREWRAAIAAAVARTRDLFFAGRPVCDEVSGRLRWELRLTWLGGMRVLEKIEASGFDVLSRRPKLTAGDVPALAWRAARWNGQGAACAAPRR